MLHFCVRGSRPDTDALNWRPGESNRFCSDCSGFSGHFKIYVNSKLNIKLIYKYKEVIFIKICNAVTDVLCMCHFSKWTYGTQNSDLIRCLIADTVIGAAVSL